MRASRLVVAVVLLGCATPTMDFGNQVTVTFDMPFEEVVVKTGTLPGTCTDLYQLKGSMTFLVDESTGATLVGEGKVFATERLIGRTSTVGNCPMATSRSMSNFAFGPLAGTPTEGSFDIQATTKSGDYTTTLHFTFTGNVRADSAWGRITLKETGTVGAQTTSNGQIVFDVVMQRVKSVGKWDGPNIG
jgi:hypothetical protein